MEKRYCKVNFSTAGGTAGAGAKTCKITLPISWLGEMGITEENRQVELSFDGEQIIVTPLCSIDQYVEKRRELGHKIYVLYYFDKESLCTTIYADETDQSLRIENHTEHLAKTAFGRNEHPTWQDYEFFLEERCIPRGRAGLREYMEAIGVLEYDPMEIILKTEGRMAEDGQWLRVEVLK